MAWKESFDPKEWRTLQFAPWWAFAVVAAADGKIDKKEVKAFAGEVTAARYATGDLIREVLGSLIPMVADPTFVQEVFSANVLTGLQEVTRLLDTKVPPDEATTFKRSLLLIGRNVAESSGGFLSMGKKTSKEEKAALGALAAVLNVPL